MQVSVQKLKKKNIQNIDSSWCNTALLTQQKQNSLKCDKKHVNMNDILLNECYGITCW